METILRDVIEESDDIRSELASCVLQNLTKEAQTGEGKISERSVYEESPQETSRLEQDINCPGRDDTRPGITPTIAISNSGALGDSNKSPDGLPSSEQNPELLSGDDQAKIKQLLSGDNEVSEPVSQKLDSSIGSETTEHSKVVKDKESLVVDEELSPVIDHCDNKQLTETSKKAAHTTPAVIQKRGRPPAAKSQGKKPARTKQRSVLKSGKVDPVSDSGRRVTRQQTKEDAKSSSTKAAEEESVTQQQKKSSLKLQKEDVVSTKDANGDTSLKEMVSETMMDKTKGQQEDSGVSKRKRLQEAEEATPSNKNKMLDENLVGSRIKVWWPDEQMFYNGVVESFNASSEKHKVSYDDGDVEVLQLTEERWEFIDEQQDSDPDAASDMPYGGRGKGSSSVQVDVGKIGTSQNDGGNPPKKRGRPKGVRSCNNMSNTDSPASSAKLKGKDAEKDTKETPKPDRRITRNMTKGSSSVQVEVGKIGTSQNGSDGGNPPKNFLHSGSDSGNPPKKRGCPKSVRSNNNMSNTDNPASSAKLKEKDVEKDTKETTPSKQVFQPAVSSGRRWSRQML